MSRGMGYCKGRTTSARPSGRRGSAMNQPMPEYVGFWARVGAAIIDSILLALGFIWVAFDNRKQGWHDKLAGTVVVRSR